MFWPFWSVNDHSNSVCTGTVFIRPEIHLHVYVVHLVILRSCHSSSLGWRLAQFVGTRLYLQAGLQDEAESPWRYNRTVRAFPLHRLPLSGQYISRGGRLIWHCRLESESKSGKACMDLDPLPLNLFFLWSQVSVYANLIRLEILFEIANIFFARRSSWMEVKMLLYFNILHVRCVLFWGSN